MSCFNLENLDPKACGLRLHRHNPKGELVSCEIVMFDIGFPAINTVLRRAGISGVVKCEPFDGQMDYFADVYIKDGNFTQSILLDRKSYAALKNHWMRCRVERSGY